MAYQKKEGKKMKVLIEKYHVSGTLEGLTTKETMNFTSWDSACEWAGTVTEKNDVPYVVTLLTNIETKENQKF